MTDYGRKPKDDSLRFEVRVTETDEVWYVDIVSVGKAWSVAAFAIIKSNKTFWTAPRNSSAPIEATDAILKALDMAEKVISA